jgi:hypothetical protein
MPTCKMKLTPLRLSVRSSSAGMPSSIDGASSSSSSVKTHCCSDSSTAGRGGLGRSRRGRAGFIAVETILMRSEECDYAFSNFAMVDCARVSDPSPNAKVLVSPKIVVDGIKMEL